MQLTLFTDYCFRVLLHLAREPQRRVTVAELSDWHGISRHHLVKVVHWLGRHGYVTTRRGKQGGLCLARAPQDINVGQVVRATEPGFDLVECFDASASCCRLQPDCGLAGLLGEATRAFLAQLDRHTLADLLPSAEGRPIRGMDAAARRRAAYAEAGQPRKR